MLIYISKVEPCWYIYLKIWSKQTNKSRFLEFFFFKFWLCFDATEAISVINDLLEWVRTPCDSRHYLQLSAMIKTSYIKSAVLFRSLWAHQCRTEVWDWTLAMKQVMQFSNKVHCTMPKVLKPHSSGSE